MGILDAPVQTLHKLNTAVIFGDSYAFNNGLQTGTAGAPGSNYSYNASQGWFHWANTFLRKRLNLIAIDGANGERTDQWLARIGTTTARRAAWAFVTAPTNDRIQGISLATAKANYLAVLDRFLGSGTRVVALGLAPASGLTAAQKIFTVDFNHWLKSLQFTRRGLIVIDVFPALNDVTGTPGGFINPGVVQYTSEGTHLHAWGAARVGRLIANALSAIVPPVDVLLSASGIDGVSTGSASPNIISNTGLNGTSGSKSNGAVGSVANSFSIISLAGTAFPGTVTGSIVAPGDQTALSWQQVAVTGASCPVRLQQQVFSGYSAGDVVVAECEFDADTDWTSVTSFRLGLSAFTTGAVEVSDFACNPSSAAGWPVENTLSKVVLRTPPLTMPSGAGSLTWLLDFTGMGTYRMRRPAIRKAPLF